MTLTPVHDPLRRRVLAAAGGVLAAGMLGTPRGARAATVNAQQPVIELEPDGLYASCSVVFALPRALEDALHRGVPLSFATRLAVVRGRWWWFDDKLAETQVLSRLSYLPLLEKFSVSSGSQQHSYGSLDEALNQVQHVLHLKLADARQLAVGQGYQVLGSFELDLSQLPRPFQLNVGGNADWQLQADFPRASFTWNPPPPTASPG